MDGDRRRGLCRGQGDEGHLMEHPAAVVTWRQVLAVASLFAGVMVASVGGAAGWISSEIGDLDRRIDAVDAKHDDARGRVFAEINRLKEDRVTTAEIVGGLRRGQDLIIRALERMEARHVQD